MLAYVTNVFSSTVSVIDLETFDVIDTIPVGEFPWDVVISPNGKRAYVAAIRADSIYAIDTKKIL